MPSAGRPNPLQSAAALPAWLLQLWCGILLLATACATPAPPPLPLPPPGRLPFVVPEPLLPIEAEGSLLIQDGAENTSGSMSVTVDSAGSTRIRLRARFTGALLLEVRMNSHRLLVLDYARTTYFEGENTAENRLAWLQFDMTADDLLMLLTARIPARRFVDGSGRREGLEASFGRFPYRYRLELSDTGYVAAWEKTVDGRPQFRVEYRAYQGVTGPGGTALALPRKIRVHSTASHNGSPPPRMVMGIRAFKLDGIKPIDMTFDPPPEWKRGRPAHFQEALSPHADPTGRGSSGD